MYKNTIRTVSSLTFITIQWAFSSFTLLFSLLENEILFFPLISIVHCTLILVFIFIFYLSFVQMVVLYVCVCVFMFMFLYLQQINYICTFLLLFLFVNVFKRRFLSAFFHSSFFRFIFVLIQRSAFHLNVCLCISAFLLSLNRCFRDDFITMFLTFQVFSIPPDPLLFVSPSFKCM